MPRAALRCYVGINWCQCQLQKDALLTSPRITEHEHNTVGMFHVHASSAVGKSIHAWPGRVCMQHCAVPSNSRLKAGMRSFSEQHAVRCPPLAQPNVLAGHSTISSLPRGSGIAVLAKCGEHQPETQSLKWTRVLSHWSVGESMGCRVPDNQRCPNPYPGALEAFTGPL